MAYYKVGHEMSGLGGGGGGGNDLGHRAAMVSPAGLPLLLHNNLIII